MRRILIVVVALAATGALFVHHTAYTEARAFSVQAEGSTGTWLVLAAHAETVTGPRALWRHVVGTGDVETVRTRTLDERGQLTEATSFSHMFTAQWVQDLGETVPADQLTGLSAEAATPRPAEVDGPSAGLTMLLAGLDRHLVADLTGGLTVAATGDLDYDLVVPVGGVAAKAAAAVAAGADTMLVPEANATELSGESRVQVADVRGANRAEALRRAGEQAHSGNVMTVVPVRDIADVLAWLCGASHDTSVCDQMSSFLS